MRKRKGATARREGTYTLRPATGAALTRLAWTLGVKRKQGEKDRVLCRRMIQIACFVLPYSTGDLN